MNKTILYYGKAEPLPTRVPLRAGPLQLVYEQGDLRYVRLGRKLVLLRVYWAVRDRNWGTVSTVISNERIEAKPDSFYISYDAHCRQPANGIDFRAQVTLVGDANGALSMEMDGEARSTFLRNRLGFCVLHPAEQAGRECVVEHVDGNSEQAKLPNTIYAYQPVEPFSEMRSLRVNLGGNTWANMRFGGDTFEMEDQRNWTDASFKTFCTPLRLPYPVEVARGTRVRQTVAVRVEGENKEGRSQKSEVRKEDVVTFSILSSSLPSSLPIPNLGLGQRYAGKVLTKKQVERLRVLKLKHLRVDLNLGDAGVVRELGRATKDATALGVALEAALFISPDNAQAQLSAFRGLLEMTAPKISHWLIYPATESQMFAPPIRLLVEAARKHLGSYNQKALFVSGTDADFIFANKQAEAYRGAHGIDAFCTCTNPQTHAFDNASLIETLAAQATLVKSAKKLAKNKPMFMTPITLRARWNPYATGVAERDLPPSDARQTTLFGAGWLLGSLKYLAEAGAASATYFETVGERGVVAGAGANVFPMYHVLADVAEFANGDVIASRSLEPLKVDGLVLRKGKRTCLLLANMTDEPQTVALNKLGAKVTIKHLDETNVALAMKSPEKYRARAGEVMKTAGGKLDVQLLPYAIARVTWSQ